MKRWTKISIIIGIVILSVAVVGIMITYSEQDEIVAELVESLNHDFNGRLEIEDSHISPFKNFPYISIDLENIKVYEGKTDSSEMLLHITDTYIGFDFFSLISGNFDVKKVTLQNGFLKLVQHEDESFNILNALSSPYEEDEMDINAEESHFHLDLKSIKLIDIDLLKLNEANNVLVEAYIQEAISSFKTSSDDIEAALDTEFQFNLILDNDTSFLHHKQVALNTDISFDSESNSLTINPSELMIENAFFLMEGGIDVDDDMNLDLSFHGNKPNFDLFLAFAPPELNPVLERYQNGGRIYFDASIKGKSINGNNPKIDIEFGCKEAFIHNTDAGKEVNDLYFEGHFSNGAERSAATMSLSVNDFSASPETGTFQGNLEVNNFDSPDIELQLISQFDLDFLVDFLNLENLEDVDGSVSLEMNFHDIIDLSQPEKSIERLNESYFTKLDVKDLSFRSTEYPLKVSQLNIQGTMDGHKADVTQLDFKLGDSDVKIKASISDLPAILHHTNIPVVAELDIKSDLIDLSELTGFYNDSTQGMDEQIKNMSMHFTFNSSAKAFTESPNLPVGEFFVDDLYAQFTHYPHSLHDFHADIMIDTVDFNIIDFSGMIDQSDFHFDGKLEHFDLWFDQKPTGKTRLDFNLTSKLLQLEDIFSYRGENFVPEDYRHEEFKDLKLHGVADLTFDKKLTHSIVSIDHFGALMKVHSMRFDDFGGTFTFDSTHLEVKDFGGRLGNTSFSSDLSYFFNSDSTDQFNSITIRSERFDFDQLFSYNPPPADKEMSPEDHEAGFNIFELPFANMHFNLEIGHLNYHRYLLDDFILRGKMQKDHYVYIDSMAFHAAGGSMILDGYFNGSNPEAIYFSPNITLNQVDLDKLLFKFENFGQDYLVSDNLHGQLSGTLSGKIHMHADMVPIIDDSELHMDINVTNGSINNYSPFEALSDYFTDRNLSNVRFDTLTNKLDLKNGELSIPSMNINSSIGYFEINGVQHTNMDYEYFMRIPIKLITSTGFKKLFGNKEDVSKDQVDEIQYRDQDEKIRFLHLKVTGDAEDYNISLGKNKN